MLDLSHLETLAKAATPGLWEDLYEVEDTKFKGGADIRSDDDGILVGSIQHECDATFIVACNPQAILELISTIKELQNEIIILNQK